VLSYKPPVIRPGAIAPMTNAKTLPPAMAASVLVAKSVRSSSDIDALQVVAALVALQMRPKQIQAITGYPLGTIRAMAERDADTQVIGRPESSWDPILRPPAAHQAASLWLQVYAALEPSGLYPPRLPGQPCPRSLVRALASTGSVHGLGTLSPGQAVLVGKAWHDGKARLASCSVCHCDWLQVEGYVPPAGTRMGTCPTCRILSTAEIRRAANPKIGNGQSLRRILQSLRDADVDRGRGTSKATGAPDEPVEDGAPSE
jgi:hypothetical protein